MPRQFFVGGNFKLNPTSLTDAIALAKNLTEATLDPNTEVVISPPALYLLPLADVVKGSNVKLAAQNSYLKPSGAFTGEISPVQLKQAGIPYVILGHSERRTLFAESSALVAQKTAAALAAGLSVILCVGETLAEREAERTDEVVREQLGEVVKALGSDAQSWSPIVIAYEPVWAIGTGRVASAQQAQDAHAAIRAYLATAVSQPVADSTRIIYGGSVSAGNCAELSAASQPDVDGFLVGGASLKPEFIQIVNVKGSAGN